MEDSIAKTEDSVDPKTKMVREVIEGVEEGDLVLFNDRKVPLVVSESKSRNNTDIVVIKGSRGGVYKFSLTGKSGSFSRATGETGEYGLRLWESASLNSVEIVDTHRIEFGNIYKREIEQSTLYYVTTGETDKFDNPIAMMVHINDGSVLSISKETFSKSFHKPKIIDENGIFEFIGSLSKYYYNEKEDDFFKIIDFGEREDVTSGIYLNYPSGDVDKDYIPYATILPEEPEWLKPVERSDVFGEN